MLPLRWEYVFHFSWFLKKVTKNDATGRLKVMFFDEKLSLGLPRFDLFSHFFSFLVVRNISDFLIPNWTIKKSEKMTEDEPRSVFAVK